MARKKKIQHARKPSISLAVIAGLSPTPIMGYQGYLNAKGAGMTSGAAINDTLALTTMRWTGYNPKGAYWNIGAMKYNLLPAFVGVGIHKLASKTGVNRMIKSAGIPWVVI
jgi:hypothetical protein